jgi:hypothetical protein
MEQGEQEEEDEEEDRAPGIRPGDLRPLASLCSLTCLALHGIHMCQADMACLSSLSSLQRLSIDILCSIGQAALGSIARLTSLSRLDIMAQVHGDSFDLACISHLTSLTRLVVPVAIGQAQLQALRPVLRGLDHLGTRRLEVTRRAGGQDQLEPIGCSSLELSWGQDGGLDLRGAAVAALLPHLQSLWSCAPSPAALHCTGLTSLALPHSPDICGQLAGSLRNLSVLQLYGWRAQLVAADVQQLAWLSQLQQLSLRSHKVAPAVWPLLGDLLRSLRRLLLDGFDVDRRLWEPAPLSAVLASLAATRLLCVVLLVPGGGWNGGFAEACDMAVASSGRQDLVMRVVRDLEGQGTTAWAMMLGREM